MTDTWLIEHQGLIQGVLLRPTCQRWDAIVVQSDQMLQFFTTLAEKSPGQFFWGGDYLVFWSNLKPSLAIFMLNSGQRFVAVNGRILR